MEEKTINLRFELFVEDVETSVNFYKSLLGFVERHGSANFVSLKNGNVQIGIGKMANLDESHPLKIRTNVERKGLGVEVVLTVDNLEEVYNNILASGYPIASPLTLRPWGLTDFRLLDPDGYYLRITN